MRLLFLMCALTEVALYALLGAAALHLLRQAWWGWRRGRLPEVSAGAPISREAITVQLPLRNEPGSAEGALRTAAALQGDVALQILDDSDDETVGIVDRIAAELRDRGVAIEVLRRDNRRGYKAGALAAGLATARDLVLVLDADFRPEPALTTQLAAALDDHSLAFVQARWSFRNERSLLTRLQAAILDALFSIEQSRLSEQCSPLQFNGTAGLWRRDAIERAGGWNVSDDALTEDLDLSFRAHEAGLRGCTLPELSVSTELPDDMAAFVAQQSRWVRGGALTLRALGLRLVRRASFSDAVTIASHFVRHARQPVFTAALVRLALVAFGVRSICPAWMGPTVIALAILASGAYVAAGARRVGKPVVTRFFEALPLALLSIGLAPSLTRAFIGGLLGERRDGFVRTPKAGEGVRVKPARRVDRLTLAVTLSCAAAFVVFVAQRDVTGAIGALFGAAGTAWVAL